MPPGQVRSNRVPEKAPQKVPEKVPGGFGAEPDQVQQGSGEGSWEALAQSQVRLNRICGHLTHGNPAEVFPALGFAARFRKSCKHKKLWPLEIPHIYIYACACENTTGIVGVRVRFVEIDPLRCTTWAVCFPRCLLECVQWGFKPFLDYLVLCGRFVGKISVTK